MSSESEPREPQQSNNVFECNPSAQLQQLNDKLKSAINSIPEAEDLGLLAAQQAAELNLEIEIERTKDFLMIVDSLARKISDNPSAAYWIYLFGSSHVRLQSGGYFPSSENAKELKKLFSERGYRTTFKNTEGDRINWGFYVYNPIYEDVLSAGPILS